MRVGEKRGVRALARAGIENDGVGGQGARGLFQALVERSMEGVHPAHDELRDQRFDALAEGGLKHALQHPPRGEDQILGVETLVGAVAAALHFLAEQLRLEVLPEAVELEVVRLQVADRLE